MGDQCIRDGGAAVEPTMVVSVGALTIFGCFSSSQGSRSCRKKKKKRWGGQQLSSVLGVGGWGYSFLLGVLPAFLVLLCSSQSPEAVAPQPGALPARVELQSLTMSLPDQSGSTCGPDCLLLPSALPSPFRLRNHQVKNWSA